MHFYDFRCTFIVDRCTFRMDRWTFMDLKTKMAIHCQYKAWKSQDILL